jgi:hypothetical protein
MLALGPSGLDGDVLTFHIAQLAQALAESLEIALYYRVRMGAQMKRPYSGHLLRRLGPSRAEERRKEQKDYDGGGPDDREPHDRPSRVSDRPPRPPMTA